MLPKSKKLRRSDFAEKGRQKFFASSPLLSMAVYTNREDSGAKFTCVIGSGVTKNKPLRNKTKRRVYDILRPHISAMPQNIKVIIFPKKESLRAKYDYLKNEVEGFLARLKLLGRTN